jgi:4-hydroxythreonine-4-phosphate dehydrogenase
VFAPLNKHALRMAGMTHEDELRWMAERLGVYGFTTSSTSPATCGRRA